MVSNSSTPRLMLLAMLAIALAAFGTSPLLYRDASPTLLPDDCLAQFSADWCGQRAILMLKTESAHCCKIRPAYSQATGVRMVGNELPYSVSGTVVYRTLFGIALARVAVLNGSNSPVDASVYRAWLGIWAGFLLIEGALSALLLRQLGIWLP